jgi:hypothetical protein
MAQLSGEQTLNEAQYIQELKLAAGKFLTRIHSLIHSLTHSHIHSNLPYTYISTGIGLLDNDSDCDNDNDDMKEQEVDQKVDQIDVTVPVVTSVASTTTSSHNIKDLLEKYKKPNQWLDNKVYTRLLLPDEFVVKESLVWKRSGWSFKHRWLVLTNKPRLFYTTPQGHYKGMVTWSMTEPIEIVQKDKTHFDISLHSSSRIYHFNDKVDGAESWVEIINEVIQP